MMLSWLFVIVGLQISSGSQETYSVQYELRTCQTGYTLGHSHSKCYKLFTEAQVWGSAIMTCKKENAKLAIPTSRAEAAYLSSELRKIDLIKSNIDYYLKYAFIGLVKRGEIDWREAYTNRCLNIELPWGRGEPNNAQGKESCLTIDRYGELNDYYCYKPAVFFCEYDLEPTPVIQYLKGITSESMYVACNITCDPDGQRWVEGCQDCVCSDDGRPECELHYACLQNPDLRPRSGPECLAGTSWQEECYECECSALGRAICREKNCKNKKQRFMPTCKTGTSWLNECNQCSCIGPGLASCTLAGCGRE